MEQKKCLAIRYDTYIFMYGGLEPNTVLCLPESITLLPHQHLKCSTVTLFSADIHGATQYHSPSPPHIFSNTSSEASPDSR